MLHPVRVGDRAALAQHSLAEVAARLLAAAMVIAALALLLVGALGTPQAQAAVGEGGPSCIMKWTTGIDCPFCGMTRATIAMGAGDWHRAFALHPLAPVVLLLVLGMLGIVAAGKTRTLLAGPRPWMLLSTFIAIWVVRLAV
ncbi:MAG TPA: DUF2752 domain-containing protein [Kofleriaceae bacterium]|nr:DUF2752 domain-containing protein [Kofleriaceae bacterium]